MAAAPEGAAATGSEGGREAARAQVAAYPFQEYEYARHSLYVYVVVAPSSYEHAHTWISVVA